MSNTQTYFAQIDENNICTSIHVVSREFLEANPERYTGTWVQTFIDVENKTYANIGWAYDPLTDDFIRPRLNKVESEV